uniref:Uncharacterized protein n=1 Tax=Neolamprologus brichardi TaxID=32507 RepID=A0A3Q4NC11_NEOBR
HVPRCEKGRGVISRGFGQRTARSEPDGTPYTSNIILISSVARIAVTAPLTWLPVPRRWRISGPWWWQRNPKRERG